MLQRLATPPGEQSRELIEQDGLVSIFLAMTAIEAFTNVYFRVIADEPAYAHASERILTELDRRNIPTGVKITTWSQQAFGHTIDETDPRWIQFRELGTQRNGFVHFRSSHQSAWLPGNVAIHGLADLSGFATLSEETPINALRCVVGIVAIIAEARGITPEQMPDFFHSWLGIMT
jgi:hypothetical protein